MEHKEIEFTEIKGDHPKRTLQNIKETDGTLIISCNLNTPGEKLTMKLLDESKKPYLIVKVIKDKLDKPSISLQKFIDQYRITTLNIAGNSIGRYKFIDQDQLDHLIYNYLKYLSLYTTLIYIK